jgi:hypothetical protein
MFERFTDQARMAVVAAQAEARKFDHDYIGTEHLLLALLRERGGVATRALEQVGVSAEQVRTRLHEVIPRGTDHRLEGHIPFTPRAKRTLEQALREAHRWRHDYLGPEHLLLGLIIEGGGVAGQTLSQAGADVDRVRDAVAGILATEPHQGQSGPPADAVFLSYRRGEAPWTAGRIYDELVRQFGARRVMMDAGPLEEILPACGTVLVLVDPGWTEPLDETVAAELALAASLHKRIIPLLVEGGTMPAFDPVLADLEPFPVDHGDFRVRMHDLVGLLRPTA